MGKLYVIMGKSAVGKDSLFCSLIDRISMLKTVVPYTTRPIRTGEVEGKEYHFVTEGELEMMRQQDRIVECRRYDTLHGPWYYFTADDGQMDFSGEVQYAIISTLDGFEKMCAFYGREHVVPVYIEVEDFLRLERALEREKRQPNPCAAELCRRFVADEEDFSEERLRIAGVKERILNHDFEEALKKIEELICRG